MRLHEAVGSLRQEWDSKDSQLPFYLGVVMGAMFFFSVLVPIFISGMAHVQ